MKTAGRSAIVLCEGGGGVPELFKFQEHFRENKITVYEVLACEDIMFEG